MVFIRADYNLQEHRSKLHLAASLSLSICLVSLLGFLLAKLYTSTTAPAPHSPLSPALSSHSTSHLANNTFSSLDSLAQEFLQLEPTGRFTPVNPP